MTFQNYTNFFKLFSAHRQPSDQRSPCDLRRDQNRKADVNRQAQFHTDLHQHLKSDLIKSYIPRGN
ncbi:MAG: hypothetical protein ACI92Z_002147 [Paracoccaceae bacterium]|jgi:hypothetical protein